MTLEKFSSMEDIRILWNQKAIEVSTLSDDEIIARITEYKEKLRDLKVTIEAAETELEKRGRKRKQEQFLADVGFDSRGAIQEVENRVKKEKKQAKNIDGAIQALMGLGLSEDEARKKLAGMK